MFESVRPREVLERLIDGISNGRWLELHELYAEEAVVEYPFALPAPTRLEGRDAIQRYFAAVARMPLELRAHNVVVHEMTDPEIVIVEYDYDGHVTTTGRAFRSPTSRSRGSVTAGSSRHVTTTTIWCWPTLPAGCPTPSLRSRPGSPNDPAHARP